MRRFVFCLSILLLTALACGGQTEPLPTPENSVFDESRTLYGFFPSPPEASVQSILNHFKSISEHADFVFVQSNIPWEDFAAGVDGESQGRTDVINQYTLTRQNGLEAIFLVDPLNGLNRREFMGLPADWQASFGNPAVRTAVKNAALWTVRQFHPRYLGLGSEINTYLDAHPEDAQNYISLYREVYAAVKAEAPETQVFVSFQWEDLNNLFHQPEEGNRQRYEINWDQVEAFEPDLDLWVISSYPFVAFQNGAKIPDGYYTPLLTRTSKPLAVAEGGYTTEPIGQVLGTPEDQVAYLNAIHDQLGARLDFWVYLLLNDFNRESYAKMMRSQGQSEDDITTLGAFGAVGLREFDGTPKPAMAVWDAFRENQ
jgi:hypothetical protein